MNWLKNKKWRFLLLFNRPCLGFLFFIDLYSSGYHLPMINLTKLTATRRHVYLKMTTFQKRSELFHGRQPEHCVCSAAPTSKADVSVGTQMDLKAMEYSHFIQMNQDLSLNITMGGQRFTGNNLNTSIFSVSVMSEQVTTVV